MVERKKPVDGHVGARLKQLREAKGMTRRQLAKMVSITPRMVGAYETGHSRMSVERLADFAAALHCRPADLLRPPSPTPATRGSDEGDHNQ